jgi:hypothetical protein
MLRNNHFWIGVVVGLLLFYLYTMYGQKKKGS